LSDSPPVISSLLMTISLVATFMGFPLPIVVIPFLRRGRDPITADPITGKHHVSDFAFNAAAKEDIFLS
jgi:hypothetical protein